MNKTELILSVSEATGFSRKNVEAGLNAAIDAITQALAKEEKVQIVGFGARTVAVEVLSVTEQKGKENAAFMYKEL